VEGWRGGGEVRERGPRNCKFLMAMMTFEYSRPAWGMAE
jgi:hypothetical protein